MCANVDENKTMYIQSMKTTGSVHFQNAQTANDLYHRIIKVFDELQQLNNTDVDTVLDRYGVRYLPQY